MVQSSGRQTQTFSWIVQNYTSRNIRFKAITRQQQFFSSLSKILFSTSIREFLESFQDDLLDSIWRENITVTHIYQVNITNLTIDDPQDVCDLSTECIDDGRAGICVSNMWLQVATQDSLSPGKTWWSSIVRQSNQRERIWTIHFVRLGFMSWGRCSHHKVSQE
jgi:hypothetical protein